MNTRKLCLILTLACVAAHGQSTCRNACATNFTITALNFVLPINKWVEYCSLTPVPGRGISCSQTLSDSEYAACLSQFCPFLTPYINAQNPECANCLLTPVTGESRTSRVFKCAATYTAEDASQCRVSTGSSVCVNVSSLPAAAVIPVCSQVACTPVGTILEPAAVTLACPIVKFPEPTTN